MKSYAYIGLALALMVFIYWYSKHEYNAGFDSATAEWQTQSLKDKAAFDKKLNDLTTKYLHDQEVSDRKHADEITKLKQAKDACLDIDMPAIVLDRVHRERASHQSVQP